MADGGRRTDPTTLKRGGCQREFLGFQQIMQGGGDRDGDSINPSV
jgi:hypothetical protein